METAEEFIRKNSKQDGFTDEDVRLTEEYAILYHKNKIQNGIEELTKEREELIEKRKTVSPRSFDEVKISMSITGLTCQIESLKRLL